MSEETTTTEEFGALEDQGTHTVTIGQKAIADIGFILTAELFEMERQLKQTKAHRDNSNKRYWTARIIERESQITELKAYCKLIVGGSEMTITHHVNTTETGKE